MEYRICIYRMSRQWNVPRQFLGDETYEFSNINDLRAELRLIAKKQKDIIYKIYRTLKNGRERLVGYMNGTAWTSEWHDNLYTCKWDYYVKVNGELSTEGL